jgi:hypothetical protein
VRERRNTLKVPSGEVLSSNPSHTKKIKNKKKIKVPAELRGGRAWRVWVTQW